MPKMSPLLVGTDLSWYASRAETRAAMLASELGAESLEVLHVIGGVGLEVLRQFVTDPTRKTEQLLIDSAAEQLAALARELAEKHRIPVTPIVEIGRAYAKIVERAAALDAGLIVLGAHGGSFVRELFIGSTMEKVLRKQSRPTLVVKREPKGSYGNVMVPVDFSESSRRAAEMALLIAPNATIVLLHAFEVPFEGRMRHAGVSEEIVQSYRAEARDQANRAMREFAAGLEPRGRISHSIEFGNATTVIRERAEAIDPDLIVMGKHGPAEWEEMLLGSVTKHVVREAGCDVMVVNADN